MRREIDVEDKNIRNNIFIGIVAFFICLLVLRLFWLQVLEQAIYKEKALKNRVRTNVIKAFRGQIFDKDGKILAQNTTGYQLIHRDTRVLGKKDIELLNKLINISDDNRNIILSKEKKDRQSKVKEILFDIDEIASISGYAKDFILDRFKKAPILGYDKTIVVIEDLEKDIALKSIEKLHNNRIDIVEYNKRYYPEKTLASHVIGNVKSISEKEYEALKDKGYRKDDMIGKKGVEKQYDLAVKGKDGEESVEVDAHGNIVNKVSSKESIAGDNIYLSIDLDLQRYMTEQFEGKTGVFIALDAQTGKILTYVSSPEIDLNMLSSKISDSDWKKLVESKEKPLVNKGISALYPPGSTFKVISGLAILENGISPTETVVSTGAYRFGRVTFRDSHTGGHGVTNFAKSIEESVNTYYYIFSQKVGRDKVIHEGQIFGIGQKTGIDLPSELSGVLPTPEWKQKRIKEKWLPGDLINMSIGQGYVLTTPLQIAMVYQSIANNGVMVYPTVVDRFVSYDGKVRNNGTKVRKKLEVSDKNLKLVQEALKRPVASNGGTARILYIPGYPVSAKTGTAQNTGFSDNHSWIAGYFPSDKPKIVFVSIVEGGGYGGVASGMLAKSFIEKYRDKYEFKKNIAEESKEKEKR